VSDESKQSALDALQKSTKAKLAQTPGITHTGQQTREYYEAQKKALDDWRENLVSNIDGAKNKNQEYLNQIAHIYNVRMKEIYAKSLADSRNWSDGVERALLSYSNSAMNAAANAEKVFSTAASRAEDFLTKAVMNAKFSFDSLKDFALSVIEDISRAMIRESITGPLMSGLSGMMGGMGSFSGLFGMFHEGGVVGSSHVPHRLLPRDFLNHAPRLHSGLAADEYPAILQRGETVISKNAGFKSKESGNVNIIFNITTPNVQSFMDSRGQIMASIAGEMDRFRQRNR
jgi:hypothetical protein